MAKYVIRKKFNRWVPVENSSWVSQVFKRYNEELERHLNSQLLSSRYTYNQLGHNASSWEDKILQHFDAETIRLKKLETLKDWSNALKEFENWTNLNAIMSISSNFEIYLASIIHLALKSNPGILLQASQEIDGVSILKYGGFEKLKYDDIVTSMTKGTWGARLNNFEKIFGTVPPILHEKISELEQIRNIRNNVGHAFGRDIDESRNHSVKNLISQETVKRERLHRYMRIIWSCAKEIDQYLMKEHIGNFQFILFYHNLYPGLSPKSHVNERANWLKEEIGKSGVATIWKQYYRGLVNYYEDL